jgi:hypothetical protein
MGTCSCASKNSKIQDEAAWPKPRRQVPRKSVRFEEPIFIPEAPNVPVTNPTEVSKVVDPSMDVSQVAETRPST